MQLERALQYWIPLFALAIAVESVLIYFLRRRSFDGRDLLANLALAFGVGVLGAFASPTAGRWGAEVYARTLAIAPIELPLGAVTVAACFLVDDFLFYWFHRTAHRLRWFWASHMIHHSSQRFNFSTAIRQTWTATLSGQFLFRAPLFLMGFPPEAVATAVSINLVYQFWIHTEFVGKLGPLEYVFNTPSHHRVHHALNVAYIDRNFGGTLIIWDRLFGTFAEEIPADPPRYGVLERVDSYNPFTIALAGWKSLLTDAWRRGGPAGAVSVVCGRLDDPHRAAVEAAASYSARAPRES